jgi:carboxylate-amine ligase
MMRDYTTIWWDVRPHPRYGTLEVRMPDQPTRLEATVSLATLVQALVARAPAAQPGDRGLYAQNRWAALRFGAAAQLVHPDGERLVSAGELLDEVQERLALADGLEPLAGLDGAGEQLEVGRRDGLRSLCEHLVALTYDGL